MASGAGRYAGLVHAAGSQAGPDEQRTGLCAPVVFPAAEGGRAADAERSMQLQHCRDHASRYRSHHIRSSDTGLSDTGLMTNHVPP